MEHTIVQILKILVLIDMIDEFNELPWHDAVLKEIMICREGEDIVNITISWPEEFAKKNDVLQFYNCYRFVSNMNFGFITPDFIFDAECLSKSPELDKLKTTWKAMGVDLSSLLCFKIKTNSTASEILIYSDGFRIKEI